MIYPNDPMPRGGVKELLKSSDGRRYLGQLQKKYELDIVQPKHNPELFEKVYGTKIKNQKKKFEEQEQKAHNEWSELRARKNYIPKPTYEIQGYGKGAKHKVGRQSGK